MPSLAYEDIYSRFYTKVKAYDLLNDYDEDTAYEILCNYLHDSVADPIVRGVFSKVQLDDDAEILTYTMDFVLDESSDAEFILKLLSEAMCYEWILAKVSNLTTITQHFSSSDAKWYAQANHLSELQNLRDNLQRKVYADIASRGYRNNDYLAGNISTRNSNAST